MVPKFKVLSEDEKKQVFDKFNISEQHLPKIFESDPVVKMLEAKVGDVLQIMRSSEVSGESVYYRLVVSE